MSCCCMVVNYLGVWGGAAGVEGQWNGKVSCLMHVECRCIHRIITCTCAEGSISGTICAAVSRAHAYAHTRKNTGLGRILDHSQLLFRARKNARAGCSGASKTTSIACTDRLCRQIW